MSMISTIEEHSQELYLRFAKNGLNKAQHDLIYSQAWDMGHSAGFSEVELYYDILIDLVVAVIASADKK